MFVIILLLLQISSSIQQSFYSFDFTISNLVQLIPHSFESTIYSNFISNIKIGLGTPYQYITVKFDPGTFINVVFNQTTQSNNTNEESLYNMNYSRSYQEIYQFSFLFSTQKIESGVYSSDKMEFGPIEIEQFFFFLSDDKSSETLYSSIGLMSNLGKENSYSSFIRYLFDNNIIKKSQYTIELLNHLQGRLIIGEANDKVGLITHLEIKMNPLSRINHFYIGSEIIIFNKGSSITIQRQMEITFDEGFNYLQFPFSVKDYIKKYYITIMDCIEKDSIEDMPHLNKVPYTYFLCNKESIQKDFPELVIKFEESYLILEKEDLFRKYDDNKMIFNVIIKNTMTNLQWIIGNPILKNYLITHDYEKKTMIFYNKRDSSRKTIGRYTKIQSKKHCVIIAIIISCIGISQLCIIRSIIGNKRQRSH